jgi:hypothetical protein
MIASEKTIMKTSISAVACTAIALMIALAEASAAQLSPEIATS